jgi:hypothetical protein
MKKRKKEKAFYIPFQAHVSDRLWREINKQKLKHIIYGQKKDWWRLEQVRADKKMLPISRDGDLKTKMVQARYIQTVGRGKRAHKPEEWGTIETRDFKWGAPGYGKTMLAPQIGEDAIVIDGLSSKAITETIKKDLRKALLAYRKAKKRRGCFRSAAIRGEGLENYRQIQVLKELYAQQVADLTLQLASVE